jgi:hypothetical protein
VQAQTAYGVVQERGLVYLITLFRCPDLERVLRDTAQCRALVRRSQRFICAARLRTPCWRKVFGLSLKVCPVEGLGGSLLKGRCSIMTIHP